MKLSTLSAVFGLIQGDSPRGRNLSRALNRHIQGDWVDRMMTNRLRREVDGVKGFRPLAAMIMYMQGSNVYDQNHNDFENELKKIEDLYTNYGCYCWIQSTADGLVGGGMTQDVTDHFCHELYFCYKCVKLDYSQDYTDVDYIVDFTTDASGSRKLDCTNNAKQDAENICECDKRFAENIAATQKSCEAKEAAHPEYGQYCLNEGYRTASGGGNFKPNSQCIKQTGSEMHEKDNCCGIYPNRYPYDTNFRDCCRTKVIDADAKQVDFFSLIRKNECKAVGGDVVVSKSGDPHNYHVVQ